MASRQPVKIKENIPNLITLLNLVSGFCALIALLSGRTTLSACFLAVAALFDFLDGMLARLLNSQTKLGEQLDSLSDVVSFGVAPGLLMFVLINQHAQGPVCSLTHVSLVSLAAFTVPVCAALRLARFNLDASQKYSFSGLPTPAVGLCIASLPLILDQQTCLAGIPMQAVHDFFSNAFVLSSLALILAVLMLAPVRLFSLKFSGWSWQANRTRFVFAGLTALLIVLFQYAAMPLIILAYLLLSIFSGKEIARP
jgi:CDP-diacylglycerol--serine O-phosphatidyltransferase